MKQHSWQQFCTPVKNKNIIDNSEMLEFVISPQKSKNSDLVAEILGQSTFHSVPFFSEKTLKIDQNYEFYYNQEQGTPSENSQSSISQINVKCQTVRKVAGSNILFLECNNPSTIKINKKGCNCDKSKCLKNYCVCYKNGNTCSSDCECIDCANTQITSQHEKNQKKALELFSSSNNKGCNCKNSNCQKGYCLCHSNGRKCSKFCRCENCFNQQDPLNDEDDQKQPHGMTTKKRIKISEFQFIQNKQNIKIN